MTSITSTTTGSISSAGLGSGLDVSSIITSLMAVESKPLDALKTAATSLSTKISTYGKLKSYFATLQDKSNALTSLSLWNATTATPSDATALKVSTGTGSVAGNYAVTVQKLASSQTVTSTALPSGTTNLNAGMLTIELGAWSGTPTDTFTAKSGSAPFSIDIGEGDTSLASIRDKINAAGAGVVASIVNDASGSRLSIRSKDSGAENAFRITASETFDDGNDATGLSSLAFDLAGGASQMTQVQTAANAQAEINGIAITSASNTLSDVVDGLTITLMKESATPVDVTVAADTAGVKTKISDFVTAFNELAAQLRSQTAYDSTSKTAGALQGDSSAVSLLNQLRGVLNVSSSASSTWTRLSDVGISMQSDGTLKVDDTKLGSALNNLPELNKLFNTIGADNASTGFVRRYKALADAALGSGGTFETKSSSLQSMLTRNTKNQDTMQLRLDQTEERLRKQYQALDATMSSLNGLSSYVSAQLAALSN
ncbi:flagellar filament capping protein FliD, partial [Aquabacterium sp.]|uniref:flagellar filament capping protein FliD n=1 Tax=Aquabacterium sp. TaxID=1872578 RepID=UPI002B6A44C9